MSHGNRHHRGKRNYNSQYLRNKNIKIGEKGRKVVEALDDSNPVIKDFRMYSKELDDKHDRYERIVKYGRDITIESKRVIFLLHTIDSEIKKPNILTEAKAKLDKICKWYFKYIAIELEGRDIYQYLKAYRGGLQEFIEAYTFYRYLEEDTLPHWIEAQKLLSFDINKKETKNNNDHESEDQVADTDAVESRNVQLYIAPNQYILGISDLTGELMRTCICSLSTGNLVTCHKTCSFVRDMYKEFLYCSVNTEKEINRKMITLKRSVIKMENVCYTLKIAGTEISQHILSVLEDTDDYSTGEDEFGFNTY